MTDYYMVDPGVRRPVLAYLGEYGSSEAAARHVVEGLEQDSYLVTIVWMVGRTPHSIQYRAFRRGWEFEATAEPTIEGI